MSSMEFFHEELIDLHFEAKDKSEAIGKIAEMLVKNGYVSNARIFAEAVSARDGVTSTNMNSGAAIAVGISQAVKKPATAIAILHEAIDWEDFGSPVDIIFLVAVQSEGQLNEHLDLFSRLSKQAKDNKTFLHVLKTTHSESVMKRRVKMAIGG